MLGNVPRGRYSVCTCRMCGRKPAEDVLYRRNQRAREDAEVRAFVSRLRAEDWDSDEGTVCDDRSGE